MKKIFLLTAVTLSFFFTACENDPFENTVIEEQTTIQEIKDLPDPDETAPALEAKALEQALESLASANTLDALPTEITGSGKGESIEDRSCIVHYDMPIFYSGTSGHMRIEEKTACFDHENPAGGYRGASNIGSGFYNTIALEDDMSYGDNRGLYLAYENYGRLKIGSVDRFGTRRDVQNYTWRDYWTHVTPLQNGMFMFYSGINQGKIYIGKYTLAGGWQGIREYGSWITTWSDFIHLGNGKVATYNRNTGALWINQIDDFGNWTVLSSTNIGAGFEQLIPLGRQTEVRSGICCYYIGQGFMGYDSNGNRLKIYNIKSSDNAVQLRKVYNTTGWRFDYIAQVQGNKFLTYNAASDIVHIGYMSETGNWAWNQANYIDNRNYTQAFTMSFR